MTALFAENLLGCENTRGWLRIFRVVEHARSFSLRGNPLHFTIALTLVFKNNASVNLC